MAETNQKLLPCPFCGSEPFYESWPYTLRADTTKHVVMCKEETCAARPSVEGFERNPVIDGWNKRAKISK